MVKTHLRNMVIVPEMIGSIIGIYNGKTFNQVEIRVSWHCLEETRTAERERSLVLPRSFTGADCSSASGEK